MKEFFAGLLKTSGPVYRPCFIPIPLRDVRIQWTRCNQRQHEGHIYTNLFLPLPNHL